MALADQWPLGDTWTYHDWHQDGNGDARVFTRAMDAKFGASSTLEDFERKAQMLNYESHRAIFEGLNAGLWRTNSGRVLWMTQPAWPSNMWQIYGADYDTHASYYGAMHAAEPVHIQLSPADDRLTVANTTLAPLTGLRWRARATTLDTRPLFDRSGTISVGVDDIADGPVLPVATALGQGPILVALDLSDAGGRVLSHNFYWRGANDAAMRAVKAMPKVTVELGAEARGGNSGGGSGGETVVTARLTNRGGAASLATKLTLLGADGARVLPAHLVTTTSRSCPVRRAR